jgi:UDP-3-O-[3-hydroxymyristoyl] glucosamine N-acyltransferase
MSGPRGRAVELKLGDLAARLHGRLQGDGETLIRGVAGIKEAGPGQITFLADRKLEEWLERTRASAVILAEDQPFERLPGVRVGDPRAAFRLALGFFGNGRRLVPAGIHPSAMIGEATELGRDVAIGPNVVIGARCRIGAGATILPGVVIGDDVVIGSACLLYPNVVVREETEIGDRAILHAGAVIGDDGFGYLTREGRHSKVPQVGRVVIEQDVEIGANSCVDRATTGTTRIRRGTRIDNLVQIAHNVVVGEDAILCAQVGIAGSTVIGDRATLGGQAGVVGHIEIGADALVGAQGGVTKSVPPGGQVSGYPATPHALARRMYAALRNLPELVREVRRLRKRVDELDGGQEGRP